MSSPEFTTPFLKSFNVERRSISKSKEGYADDITTAIELNELTESEVICRYVEKSRIWLSFKKNTHVKPFNLDQCPKLDSPNTLLTSFGKPGWYGPVIDAESKRAWYIKISKIKHYIRRDGLREKQANDEAIFETTFIRWPVIAEVSEEYLALHWDGFSYSSQERPTSNSQFSFWLHIPEIFNEAQKIIGGKWEHANLSDLLLHNLWEKFNKVEGYTWSHKRVRAETAGIALNAHSSGDEKTDLDDRGLKRLSRTLAEAALDSLEETFPHHPQTLEKVEEAILNTLVREWGTKSYEFRLKKIPEEALQNNNSTDDSEESKSVTIFQVHCYFGLTPFSKNQDALQHLKCFIRHGGSAKALKFLITELSETKKIQKGGDNAVCIPEQTELFG